MSLRATDLPSRKSNGEFAAPVWGGLRPARGFSPARKGLATSPEEALPQPGRSLKAAQHPEPVRDNNPTDARPVSAETK
jgi:hypothetical protein